MGQKITLGGDRLGSGKKNEIYLHNYNRSTHNLSRKFTSSLGVGMLIPFYTNIATRGDKFEINLSAGLRTIPTKGPLFGSFKLQLDFFRIPLRLYQAILHNNPLAIGLKTQQIKWPKIKLWDKTNAGEINKLSKSANNSLIKYLGISGLGTLKGNAEDVELYNRNFFGAGLLAYYDIFKNYYANKQEENAYVVDRGWQKDGTKLTARKPDYFNSNVSGLTFSDYESAYYYAKKTNNVNGTGNVVIQGFLNDPVDEETFVRSVEFGYGYGNDTTITNHGTLFDIYYGESDPDDSPINSFEYNEETGGYVVRFKYVMNSTNHLRVVGIMVESDKYSIQPKLQAFKLENIDKARMDILSFHELGQSYTIDCDAGDNYCSQNTPYVSGIGDASEISWQKNLTGIVVKTYQSDLFNNWINTEWIDGENGIAAITAVATTDGAIKIDALNFAEKLYNLLNRVAASDGTYEGYLDVAYTESDKRFCESPMWIGGMSDEIVFEEIVQTAPADGDPLGTLGGRGNLKGNQKGGKITCKIDEPSLIMGIVSITPRIVYTQGNKWFNTELDNLADIHVPALDGIAFQNLMAEQMHFGAAVVSEDGTFTRPVIGKVPAWINYMTDYDEAYGDFAETDGNGYMVLNRNYTCTDGMLQDATTYIDPAKFNYAFAYSKLDAQNFWVQIYCDVKSRRLMSAKQIPSI